MKVESSIITSLFICLISDNFECRPGYLCKSFRYVFEFVAKDLVSVRSLQWKTSFRFIWSMSNIRYLFFYDFHLTQISTIPFLIFFFEVLTSYWAVSCFIVVLIIFINKTLMTCCCVHSRLIAFWILSMITTYLALPSLQFVLFLIQAFLN